MLVELYVLPSCPYCEKARTLLSRYNIPYESYTIGIDVERQKVIQRFPGRVVAPIVVKDGELMGGWSELLQWVSITDFSKELRG